MPFFKKIISASKSKLQNVSLSLMQSGTNRLENTALGDLVLGPLSENEKEAIDWVKTNHSDLFAAHETYIVSGIRFLLPLNLERCNMWATAEMEKQVQKMALSSHLSRQLSVLGVPDFLEEASKLTSKGSVLKVFSNPLLSLTECKMKGLTLQLQMSKMVKDCEDLHIYFEKSADVLRIASVVVSAVLEVSTKSDPHLLTLLNNRLSVLNQMVPQQAMARVHFEQTRVLIVDYQNQVEHVNNVLLPYVEMALTNASQK